MSPASGQTDNSDKLIKAGDEMHMTLCSSSAMDKFLDPSSMSPLQASLMPARSGQFDIELSNQVALNSDAVCVLYFTKSQQEIDMSNIQQSVGIASMSQSAVQGLYNSLHNIFLPLLSKDSAIDDHLKSLVHDLDEGLGSVMRGTSGGPRGVDENSVQGIVKLEDEASFWREVVHNGSGPGNAGGKAEFLQGKVNELVKELEADESIEDMTEKLGQVLSCTYFSQFCFVRDSCITAVVVS